MIGTPDAFATPGWVSILISAIALIIAGLSLGWNIYRDVVLRARVILSFGVKWISPGTGVKPFYKLMLSAVNHGPGKVRFSGYAQMKNAPLWRRMLRREQWFAITPELTSPYATKLPVVLDVGDEMTVIFPYDAACFLSEPVTHIGLRDSFGRFHWAPKSDVRAAVKQFKKDF